MIKPIDRHKSLLKKKLWDIFDWGYRGSGVGYFRNHRSLNCGCSFCQCVSDQHNIENKRDRAKAKLELKTIDG